MTNDYRAVSGRGKTPVGYRTIIFSHFHSTSKEHEYLIFFDALQIGPEIKMKNYKGIALSWRVLIL